MATAKTESLLDTDLTTQGDSAVGTLLDSTTSAVVYPPAASAFGDGPAVVEVQFASTTGEWQSFNPPAWVRPGRPTRVLDCRGVQQLRTYVRCKGGTERGGTPDSTASFYLVEQSDFNYTTTI